MKKMQKIIVYEYASRGSLDRYLNNSRLTWMQRLKICIDVATALDFLHRGVGTQAVVTHRDIKTPHILLYHDCNAKLAEFGLSLVSATDQETDYVIDLACGTPGYVDAFYLKSNFLSKESDIYSFGVVLFEILCGRSTFEIHQREGVYLPIFIKDKFEKGKHDMVVFEEIKAQIKPEALNAFQTIAYRCLNENREERPKAKEVVEQLKKALQLQVNNKEALRISLEDIQLATGNFHVKHCVGKGWSSIVYRGKLPQSDDMIVAKRFDTRSGRGDQHFRNELQIHFEYKHDNIISLVGYCDEKDAKIIIYEYASRGSLDRYLNNSRLTWMQRLKICIDVATALDFLHRGVGTQAVVTHRDIKTPHILLYHDCNAKLAEFGLSLVSATDQETDYVIDLACGTPGYVDAFYLKSNFLSKESDIYSFGVVLFEILCGRSTFEIHQREGVYLPIFIKDKFEKGKHDMVVFEEIKAQIKPEALNAFQTIAYRCLNENREERPKVKEVVEQLKKALQLQFVKSQEGHGLKCRL